MRDCKMKVKLVSSEFGKLDCAFGLTPKRVYEVIGIEADYYRIWNDDEKPCLYPLAIFTIVDTDKPEDWVIEVGEDGEIYAYSPELNAPGFFEDYFDNDPDAIFTFQCYLNK